MTDKKRYYFREGGYETDWLIDRVSDEELLMHMGVPATYVRNAVKMQNDLPDEVEEWLASLQYIFLPSMEDLDQGMCGTNLIFTGPGSTRKTTTAVSVLLRAIREGRRNTDPTGRNFTWHGKAMGRFVDWQDVSEVFRTANSGDEDAVFRAEQERMSMYPTGPVLSRGDFLVVDDISRERTTEFNSGELQRILRRRSDNGFPSIITTNHRPEDWDDKHGEVLAGFLRRSSIAVEFIA